MNNKEKNFVSAVVYLYNEENTIQSYVKGLEETLKQNFEKYEIVVVNDASTDSSVKSLKAYVSSQEEAKVTIVNMGYHQGLETAMEAGVDLAIGDFVFEIESADADYNWTVLMDVYRRSLEGYDIVNARGNLGKKVTVGSVFYNIMNRFANLQYPLASGSFRIVSRRAINRIHSLATKIPYRKVAYSNCGLKCDTLLYDYIKKRKSRKISNRVELATTSLVLFTDVAFHITIWLTVILFVFSFVMTVYSLTLLWLNNTIEGWVIVVLFLGYSLSGLFVVLSMVVRYLSTIVKLNYLKKEYIFESIEKLQK